MDLRSRLTMPIAELARLIQAHSYPSLHQALAGKRGISVAQAKKIEAATNGAILWTEFFPDAPGHPSSSDPAE